MLGSEIETPIPNIKTCSLLDDTESIKRDNIIIKFCLLVSDEGISSSYSVSKLKYMYGPPL